MKNDDSSELHHLTFFCIVSWLKKHNVLCIAWHADLQLEFVFFFQIIKCVLLPSVHMKHMMQKPNNILIRLQLIFYRISLIPGSFVASPIWCILNQNRVLTIFASMKWFARWIIFDQHFQCRHLVLLNRFRTIDVIFIAFLSLEVVPTWSDKKNFEN